MDTSKSKKSFDLHEFPPVDTATWEAVIEKDLKGENYKETLSWDSGEGIEILPFYRLEHLDEIDIPDIAKTSSNFEQSWEIKERISADDLASANKFAVDALQGGATALFIDLDRKLFNGPDDLEKLFNGIIIEIIGVHFSKSLSDLKFIEAFDEFATKRGHNSAELNVSFQLDPLTTSLTTGELISEDNLSTFVEAASNKKLKNLAVLGSEFQNLGSSIVDELAFSLAAANEYLGANKVANTSIHFNFGIGSNYFLEIGKFRAFRVLWAQISEAYDLASHKCFVSAETSLTNKSSIDGNTNILRVTTEAMSAAIGTADSILIRPFDEVYKDENSFSQRISRNIQHLLIDESYLNKVEDASKGSYYIEKITASIVEKAWERFQEIEAKGGFIACVKEGFIQSEIRNTQALRSSKFEEQKKVMIGVNKYPPAEIEKMDTHEYSSNVAFKAENSSSVETLNYFRYAADLEKGVEA